MNRKQLSNPNFNRIGISSNPTGNIPIASGWKTFNTLDFVCYLWLLITWDITNSKVRKYSGTYLPE